MLRASVVAFIVLSAAAQADDATKRAREELEQQLREMVRIPESRVVISFQALEEPNFKLDGTEFLLDGRALPTPSASELSQPGEHRVYAGELPEGRHELIARVAYVDDSSVLVSEQAGFKWKVSAAVRFETRRGLEVAIRTVPERVPEEKDLHKQIRVKFHQGVNMVAQVDTSIPPPLERPKPVAPVEQVAEARPAQELMRDEAKDGRGKPTQATGKRSKAKKEKAQHTRDGERRADEGGRLATATGVRPVSSRGSKELEPEPAAATEPAAAPDAGAAGIAAAPAEPDAGIASAAVAVAAVERDAGAEEPVTAPEPKATSRTPILPMVSAIGVLVVLVVVAISLRRRR